MALPPNGTLVRFLSALVLLAGCQHRDPAPGSTPASASSPAPVVVALPASVAAAPPATSVVVDAGPVEAAAPKSVVPVLVDADGGALPQTEARPSVDSPFFQELGRRLFAAIVADDPELAHDLFFPLEAYRQVKDVAKPERDYKLRLLAHFDRDIHEYHRKVGDGAELIELSVPSERAKWMKPGSEGNKLGYFRVLRSALRYRDAKGKEHSLEVTSLISWRGEWYVVHVHGFT